MTKLNRHSVLAASVAASLMPGAAGGPGSGKASLL